MARAYSGSVIKRVRRAVWDAYPHVCHICNEPIASFREYEPDHLVPRALGGSLFDLKNLRPSHGTWSKSKCNQRRGARAMDPESPPQSQDNRSWFL